MDYVKTYWSVLKEFYPRAFRQDYRSEYLVLRSLSVYALNRLANDIFNWCREDGIKNPSKDDIKKYLNPLRGFNWSRRTSPIAAFGGQKGVDAAYKELLEELNKGGVEKAKYVLEPLRKFMGENEKSS